MKAEGYIITIETNSNSVRVSERCADSAFKFGIHTNIFSAYTPRHEPIRILESKGVDTIGLHDSRNYSYIDAAAGCFLSHFMLWEKCVQINKPIIIFEHDAIVINEIPLDILDGTGFDQVVNLGTPATGIHKIPEFTGVGLLSSSHRFKGTYGYAIKPTGALKLIDRAKNAVAAADMFLNTNNFPFLQELHPWPVITTLEFSTIQKKSNKYSTNNRLDEFGNRRDE